MVQRYALLISLLSRLIRSFHAQPLRLRIGALALASLLFVLPGARAAAFSIDTASSSLSGFWWNQSESGWGLSLNQQGANIFVGWYTYDASGAPRWYVMSNCAVAGNACIGDIYSMRGGTPLTASWNGNAKVLAKVGAGSLVFADNNSGIFNFTIGTAAGSKNISRQSFSTGAAPPPVDYSGLWWNTNESGWGVALTHQYGVIFAALYVFDPAGNPVWYVASDCAFIVNDGMCSGILYQTTGGSVPFGPWTGSVKSTPVGSITLAFADADNGKMSFTIDGVAGSKAISRLPAIIASPSACKLSAGAVAPVIASQAQWDAHYDAMYGKAIAGPLDGPNDYAWHGHYWVRAFVSMAKTFGDTKYLDRAIKMIDYWFAHSDTPQGWGASLDPASMMLDTGVMAQAIAIFAYEAWSDPRFVGYRPAADLYVAKLEPMLHTYDVQWVDTAPYPGSPAFYRYATCDGLCVASSLLMYNQGATMAKALLLIDRIYRIKGLTPDASYLHKADAAAAYFKTFARQNGNAYVWNYGGAVPQPGIDTEDTDHGHLDMSLLIWARNFGLGGLTSTDMQLLTGTANKIFNGAAGPNDVSPIIDGTGKPTSAWDRVSVGYDWIDMADYDPTLLDKTVNVFNTYLSNPDSSRFYLGWAEILRKARCSAL